MDARVSIKTIPRDTVVSSNKQQQQQQHHQKTQKGKGRSTCHSMPLYVGPHISRDKLHSTRCALTFVKRIR